MLSNHGTSYYTILMWPSLLSAIMDRTNIKWNRPRSIGSFLGGAEARGVVIIYGMAANRSASSRCEVNGYQAYWGRSANERSLLIMGQKVFSLNFFGSVVVRYAVKCPFSIRSLDTDQLRRGG